MDQLTTFEYPNAQAMAQCEIHADAIRGLRRSVARDVAEMGRRLEQVYCLLNRSRPAFLCWLDAKLGVSEDTATNWRRWAEFVDDNPNALGLSSMRLAYRVAALPAGVRNDVVDRGALTEAEAIPVIVEHKQAAWKRDMETYLAEGVEGKPTSWERRCGDVLHWAREAMMNDPELRDVATEIVEEHASAFARLSGMTEEEVKADNGMTRDERLPPLNGPVTAFLREGMNGDRCPCCGGPAAFRYDALEVNIDGTWHKAVAVRHDANPAVRSWQKAFVRGGVEATGTRTVDDFAGCL